MRFSLILATVGRTEEVKRFLEHLDRQTYRKFELIVVDQNPDDRLVPILEPYKERFPILHLRTLKTGVSRARNIGFQHAKGDIVSFPDDDCWYPANLLEEVAEFFKKHPKWDGITGRSVDAEGSPSVGRWGKREGVINRFNEWTRSVEFSIFVRRAVVEAIGGFDEELGPGASTPWGAHEGDDLILRALQAGFSFYYNPRFLIYHPQPVQSYDIKALKRARVYAQGMGRVLRKHRYPFWFVAYFWIRSLGGALLSLAKGNFGKARYYWATFEGRVLGWVRYK
jgi:glycosyltransferase involved in cell wall biosynthesis